MYNSFLTLLFLSCAFVAAAQKPNPSNQAITPESLMKNPDVLWIGESEEVILLDVENPELLYDREFLTKFGFVNQQGLICTPLKNQFDRKTVTFDPADFAWINKMIYGEKFKNIRAYKDAACTQAVKNPQELAQTIDTVIVFDSETFAENVEVIANPINSIDVQSYKLRQLFYFDKKANTFGSLPLAFAPILIIYDDYDVKKFTFRELFWIKIDYSSKMPDLNNKDILWARQTARTYTFEKMKTLKSEKSLKDCLAFHIETVRKNAQTEDLREDLGRFERISSQKIATIGDKRDTIIKFNEETFEETEKIVETLLNVEDIKEIRFVQEWYWDERQNRMMVHNLFFAPIVNKYEPKARFFYAAPLYFKKAK